MTINLIDNKGKITQFETEDGPFKFELETVWGKKDYTLEFCFSKDRATKEVDKSKITGARLF